MDKYKEQFIAIRKEELGFFVGGAPTEFDQGLNTVTRQKLHIYALIHGGKCWVGNVNLYDDKTTDADILQEYTVREDRCLNFEWSFVIPRFNQKLLTMIRERHESPYEGTKKDYKSVEAIHKKMESLGGHYLHWV